MAEYDIKGWLDQCYQNKVNALFKGPPGVGKSAIVDEIVRKYDLVGVTKIGSICDPTDFGGQPQIVQGSDYYKLVASEFVHIIRTAAAEGRGTYVFIDEIFDSPRAVQAALQRMIHERVVGDVSLPTDTWFVAAGNPAEYSTNGTDLSGPLANRFVHATFSASVDDFCQNFGGYWGNPPDPKKHGWNATAEELAMSRSWIAGFIKSKPDCLLDFPKDEDKRSEAWPSPRTWEVVSRFVAKDLKNPQLHLVESAVGRGAAMSLVQWLKTADLPDPETVLANPTKFVVPSRIDLAYAVLSSVHTAVKGKMTEARWHAEWKVLDMVNKSGSMKDVATVWARQAARIMPSGSKVPPEVMSFAKILSEAGITFGK